MSRVIFLILLTQSLCNVSDAQLASSVPIRDLKRAGDLDTVPGMDDAAIEDLSLVEDDLNESNKDALAMAEEHRVSEMEALALLEDEEGDNMTDLDNGGDVEENKASSSVSAAKKACPSGWSQLGQKGDDVPGWGLARSGNKATSQADCALKCNSLSSCGSFEYRESDRSCGLNSWAQSTTRAQTSKWGDVITCKKQQAADGDEVCGGVSVDWAAQSGYPAIPTGWTATGFHGGANLKSNRGCGGGWSAYAGGGRQGELKTTLKTGGKAEIEYGDCWGEGHVGLYINGKQIDRASDGTKTKTHKFDFQANDVLMLKDEGRNAVLTIKSIKYTCNKACSTFTEKGDCPDDRCSWTGSQCSGDCSSIAAPANGGMGTCKASMISGDECRFSCNGVGYGIESSICTKGVFRSPSCQLMYKETKFGSNKCPTGFKLIDDLDDCKLAGTKLKKHSWRNHHYRTWGNIQYGCFSHRNKHIWFNKNKDGTVHGHFSSICKKLPELCSTFATESTCPGRCVWSGSKCGGDCDASAAPANGVVGNCPNVLAAGSTCQPSCIPGFKVKGDTSCTKGVFVAATCELQMYDETKFGSNKCPKGFDLITDLDECKLAGTKLKKHSWRNHHYRGWHNIQYGCFSHSNKHIWFNKDKNGRVHSHFSSICKRSFPGCKGVTAPANGQMGCCNSFLSSSKQCTPTCDEGFELGSPASCFNGTLTAATCKPLKACNVSAPANGGLGSCGSSLASHKTCQPECGNNYTVSGTSTCFDGVFTPAKCVAPPSCAVGKVCSTGKWSLYYSNKSQEECKAMCDDGRKMISSGGSGDGVQEDMYQFRQDGKFHNFTCSDRQPTQSRKVSNINYPGTGSPFKGFKVRDHFYVRWSGFIEIKAGGTYTFYTESDDGSRLYIDGQSIVQNPGWHGMRFREGKIDGMAAGKHPFSTEMFEGGGGAGMRFWYQGPDTGNKKVIVPGNVLYTSKHSGSGSGSGAGQLNPAWKDIGKCMAYSWNGNECIIYSACTVLGAPGDDQQVCGEKMDWSDPSTFSTCTFGD